MAETKVRTGLIGTRGENELFINLRKHVVYVILKDPEHPKILAKVIDVNGRRTFSPFDPNGNIAAMNTAAMLLYLLARDDDDDVLLADYINFIVNHLPPKSKGQYKDQEIKDHVINFLQQLESSKILKVTIVIPGTLGGADLDPVDFLQTLDAWEVPALGESGPPIVKTTTYYSTNLRPVPTKRG